MFTHDRIWQAIDQLAQKHGYSASGLARKAGLDPTTFNKSKRISQEGKPRWPSTESISKILSVTQDTMANFLSSNSDDNDQLKNGQSVVLKTKANTTLTGTLIEHNDEFIRLSPTSDGYTDNSAEQTIAKHDIAWVANIVFVS